MKCEICGERLSIDRTISEDTFVVRYRQCEECGNRVKTVELEYYSFINRLLSCAKNLLKHSN